VLTVLPLVESLAVVIVANAVLWFVAAAAGPVLSLLAVAGAPEPEWGARYALLNKYQGWGWAGGLVLGSVWTAVGNRLLTPAATQRTFFLACAACAGLAVVLAARWLPADREVTPPENPRAFARTLARTCRLNVRGATFPFSPARLYWTTRAFHPRAFVRRFSAGLAAYYGAAFLFFTGFAAFFAPLPLYLTDQGFASGAVFYVGAGELANRYDLGLLQTGGLVVRGIALPAVAVVGGALATSLTGVVLTGAVFVVIGLAWALIAVTATTLVTRLAPAGVRGEALGVYTAIGSLAGGVGSFIGGLLAAQTFVLAFTVAAGFVLGGAGIVVALRLGDGHTATTVVDAAD
jgi:MFS family permease